ncbi:hypothetical protein QYF36_014331 [Acer negundo]|nr:hypothetical protein QYF36_014331 [Acer negundo]
MRGETASEQVFAMDALHYLGLLVSVLVIVYQFTATRRNQHKNLPPSPPGVPIIVHFHPLKKSHSPSSKQSLQQAMLIAGTHSTATTMESVAPHLISHPDVLQNVRDEIGNHVGNSRLISDTDLTKLPYLLCVINETLRLSPVGVLPPCESSEDCIVGGYHIPRGTQLFVNTMAVHRDPELWKEPDRFKPERFLESEEGKERFRFIVFGIGRRICPGEGVGMRVVALSLGTLIQCFDWEEATDESQGQSKTNLNRPMKRPIEIVFRPREALTKVLAQL